MNKSIKVKMSFTFYILAVGKASKTALSKIVINSYGYQSEIKVYYYQEFHSREESSVEVCRTLARRRWNSATWRRAGRVTQISWH